VLHRLFSELKRVGNFLVGLAPEKAIDQLQFANAQLCGSVGFPASPVSEPGHDALREIRGDEQLAAAHRGDGVIEILGGASFEDKSLRTGVQGAQRQIDTGERGKDDDLHGWHFARKAVDRSKDVAWHA